jgi:putative ABC transport system substrate-binding protein
MLSRRALIAAAASAAAIPSALTPLVGAKATPAAEPAYASWFKFAPTVVEKWSVRQDGDPNWVKITPLKTPGTGHPRKILVMYPRPSSAYDIAITKILGVFSDKELNVELTVTNFGNDEVRGRAALAAAHDEHFDLIMSMGSEATAWLWERYRGGMLPVLSVCSKDPVVLGQSPGYNRGSGTNFAFTSLNMPIEAQMAYVNELKPRLKNIAILVDSRNVSAVETQSRPVIDYLRPRGVRVFDLAVQDPANAKAELERMMRDATAQMMRNDPDLTSSVYWVTGSTSVFREIATINAYAGRAAVLSAVPDVVRGGDDSAMLSIGISFESNAHVAAVYAADIIRGRAKASELPVGLVTPPDIAINFRKVRDIGMTVPLSFFEAAGTIYDYDGRAVRIDGVSVPVPVN